MLFATCLRMNTVELKSGKEAETVLEDPAPTSLEAEAIAQQVFSIEATAPPLGSERDQNFR